MTEIAPFAPIRVNVEFSFTGGNQVAQATYGFPSGVMPSEADVEVAAASTLKQIRDQLGEGFWWQTRHGFVSDEFAERMHGMRFAIPGPDIWEAEWAA